jgi:dienelactone hydrolase
MRHVPGLPALLLGGVLAVLPGLTRAEQVVEVPSRGQSVRILMDRPAQPKASVVLVPGGNGDLHLTPTGGIGSLASNQLVRARALFVRAGYAVALADIAPDMRAGDGVRPGYRWSEDHAQDLGAVIAAMRQVARPVVLVGTSRGALSVANAASRLQGAMRPDAVVITSGMLMDTGGGQPSVQRNVPGIGAVTQPVLLVVHTRDACPLSPPDSAARFRPLLRSATKVDVVSLNGGGPGRGDPCEGASPHGFAGMDQQVVDAITTWVGR